MGKQIGIHLGRKNSIAAFYMRHQAEVVTADDNVPPDRKLTPSVVAYKQGSLLIGEKAHNQLWADPENVIVSIIDLMGRSYNGFDVQKIREQGV